MKKGTIIISVIISALIYFILYPAGSATGLIHPACYAYVGTVLSFVFAFIYFFVCTKMRCFGAALCLNAVVVIGAFISGEGNLAFAVIMFVLTAAAEVVRLLNGYDTIKGIKLSTIPFAYSFYAYTAHWWTNTEYSLGEALEEMPVGYADKMSKVISNVPGLIIALILVIPIAILGAFLAGKALKKQAEGLE